jgi:uncharacterized protein YqeY
LAEILDRLDRDMKVAMKERDKFTLSVIRMMRSELKYAEIALGSPLADEQVIEVLARELKKREDAAGEFAAAGRAQTAESLNRELDIIMQYLPEPLTEEQLRDIITEAINATGAESKADFGKVMGRVMPQVKGRSDGNMVMVLVKQLLDR